MTHLYDPCFFFLIANPWIRWIGLDPPRYRLFSLLRACKVGAIGTATRRDAEAARRKASGWGGVGWGGDNDVQAGACERAQKHGRRRLTIRSTV